MRLGTALVSTAALGLVVGVGGGGFTVGAWAWWVAFGVFVVLQVVDGRGVAPEVWLGALCVSALAVYLLAARTSITALCLVTSASAAGFVVAPRRAAVVTVAQTGVVAVGQVAVGASATAVVATTATFGGFQAFAALMAVSVRRESRHRAELARVNDDLRSAQALLRGSARSGERLRISRELHDVVGHRLTALALELEVAAHHAGGDAAEHVERARRNAKALLADLRRALGGLRATPDEVPSAVGALTAGAKPRVHLDIDDDLEFTDPDHAHALVRCVQEIVTNAVRHADADNLWISVRGTDGGVAISAHDDGRGTAAIRPGLGLTGMRERVVRLGGSLTTSAAPGQGFRLDVRLPAP